MAAPGVTMGRTLQEGFPEQPARMLVLCNLGVDGWGTWTPSGGCNPLTTHGCRSRCGTVPGDMEACFQGVGKLTTARNEMGRSVRCAASLFLRRVPRSSAAASASANSAGSFRGACLPSLPATMRTTARASSAAIARFSLEQTFVALRRRSILPWRLPLDGFSSEKSGPGEPNCIDKQGSVQMKVSCFTTRLRNQETTVTGGSVQRSILISRCWVVIRAYGVIRAEPKAL